jgi:hypothetical protein
MKFEVVETKEILGTEAYGRYVHCIILDRGDGAIART